MKKLKKIGILLLIFATSALSSTAQLNDEELESKVRFGFKAGVNYSNIYNTKTEDFVADGKAGLAAGAFVSIPIGEYIGVQPEIQFSQRGFKADGTIYSMPYTIKRTSNYLDFPILFSVRPARFISILLGPQYSFLLYQKDRFESSLYSFDVEQEFENDNIRRNTLCLVGGFDINLAHVVVGLRTGWDLLKNRGDGSSTTPQYKNAWAQLTVGYRF